MIQSLDRAMKILSLIADQGSMGVTVLAKELGVNKSTVSRLLDTLRVNDMVQVDPKTSKYRLGFRILHLSESIKSSLNVIEIARPVILKLSQEINESVHLCAFNNNCVYVVDQVRSNKVYSLSATVGMIEPFHCSSVGKCILAYQQPETIRMLLTNYELTRYTKNTITDIDTLMLHLNDIRSQGYSVDDEEMAIGVRCISVPIFNHRNSVRYSIGISGPRSSMSPTTVEETVNKMTSAAKEISCSIGWERKTVIVQ